MYASTIRKIGSLTLGLVLVHFLIRSKILFKSYYVAFIAPKFLLKTLLACYYDLAYVLGLSAVFVLLAYLCRYKAVPLRYLGRSFKVLTLLNILLALSNIKAVQMLGISFNYQWLYYSDFLGNSDTMHAIKDTFTLRFLSELIAFSLFVLGFSALANNAYIRLYYTFQPRRSVMYGFALLTILYFSISKSFIKQQLSYGQSSNSVIAFAESFLESFKSGTSLFTMELPEDFELFHVVAKKRNPSSGAETEHGVRNVILFVLESVHANYVSGYADKYNVTPNIKRYLSQALLVKDAYAHIPSTHNSMVSMMGSMYPMISYKAISKEHPDLVWPTISAQLKEQGYQTAFFHASDNRFQGIDNYLSYRKFDKIADFSQIPCNKEPLLVKDWENLSGVDEDCMVNDFLQWVSSTDAAKPFFATLWTMRTHYPYFSPQPEKDYGVDDEYLNRYLNALQHTDAVLGKLLQTLQEKGLAESTLVVIVGDHGEAFLQHYTYGHASTIYEENVKVPMIFINPKLFKGDTLDVIAGHIDLAPTIMDIINKPVPEEWQGTSIFDSTRINRAYFFNPYSEYLFGYRTENLKVILNASNNRTMVFDLLKDPEEKVNIAEQMPDFVVLSHRRLAQWVQFHKEVVDERIKLTKGKVKNTRQAEE